MAPYQPYLALEDVRWVQQLPPGRRKRVIEALARLHASSDTGATAEGLDDGGRPLWSITHRGVFIVFWIDHAERRVMIVELELVGR